MSVDNERRLASMKRGLERENAKVIDLAMDVTLAIELLEDQNFLVDVINDCIRRVEAGEDSSDFNEPGLLT